MCQCGCGEFGTEKAYKLPSGEVIAYGIYEGCSDCFAGPGISIYAYPDATSEWIEDTPIEDYKPDEFGGNHGHGISLSFFEVRDFIKAAQEIGGTSLDEDGYNSVEDWLEENGLEMMQKAMKKFKERIEKLERKSGE